MLAGNGPSPEVRFPLPDVQRLGFLRQFITRPTIIVGDYTYYDDPRGPGTFRGQRPLSFRLHRGSPDNRQVLFDRGRDDVHHERREPHNDVADYLSVSHFGHGWEAADPPSWPRKGRHGGAADGHCLVGLGCGEGHPQCQGYMFRRRRVARTGRLRLPVTLALPNQRT